LALARSGLWLGWFVDILKRQGDTRLADGRHERLQSRLGTDATRG
jgi:hypothetical protein